MKPSSLLSRLGALALLAVTPSAFAQFSPGPNPITTSVSGPRTLTSGTGTISSTGTLTVTGSSAGVTMSGGTAGSPTRLINSGTLQQTVNGRAVQSSGTGAYLAILNNFNATISTAGNDTIAAGTGSTTVASVSLTNHGTISSAGGGQAVNFNKILSAPNSITNDGSILATNSDAVRTGVNGTVDNAGIIKSTTNTGSSSDGIDAQNNTGAVITNWGLIQGGRHGITGGAVDNTVFFTTSVTNNAGGTIQGDNGSGINLDGFDAKQTATIVNNGTITGNGHDIGDGKSHDGDGIDVDGVVNITNTGVIRSINAFAIAADGTAYSEGITVGGGTITNSGTIEGLVAGGNTTAVGRGITLAGNDITTGPLAGTREAIYASAVINNNAGGLIRGDSDSGIAVDGAANTHGYTVTINNNAGATVQGGGTVNAAIRTGADDDTINNAGTIDGGSSGKAIDMGGGNNTLNITGGSASIVGSISGGIGGTNTLTINPGAGQTFSYNGSISNFSSAEVKSGSVKLYGASTYAGNTLISGGTLFANNTTGSATGTGDVTVKNLATLAGNGTVGGNVFVQSGGILAPGNSPGTLAIGGNLTLAGSSHLVFDLGANAASSDLLTIGGALGFSDAGPAVFDFNNNGATVGTYTLLTFGSASGLDLSKFTLGTTNGIFGNLVLDSNSLSLNVTAVPEPATTAAWLGSAVLLGVIAWRKRDRRAAGSAV